MRYTSNHATKWKHTHVPRRALALLLVLTLLFTANGPMVVSAEPADGPPTVITLTQGSYGAIPYNVDMLPYNIQYGDWVLQSVRFIGLYDNLMAGEARLVSIEPYWRRTTIGQARYSWDIPGFNGFSVSSDESVFQLELSMNTIALDRQIPKEIWVLALQEGTAFLQFHMPDDGIILQAAVTVSPRPEPWPEPNGFLADPQVVRVAPGESAVMTLSNLPGGVNEFDPPPVVGEWFSSDPSVAVLGAQKNSDDGMRQELRVRGLQPGSTFITMMVTAAGSPYGEWYTFDVVVEEGGGGSPPENLSLLYELDCYGGRNRVEFNDGDDDPDIPISIRYGDWRLEHIQLSVDMYIRPELRVGEALIAQFSPSWRSSSVSQHIKWNIPGFEGIQWSSSDESVFRLEYLKANDIVGTPRDRQNPTEMWVVGVREGTAMLRLALPNGITLQQRITVLPRPAVYTPFPPLNFGETHITFSVDPQVLRVPENGSAVTTLSSAPMVDSVSGPIVGDWISSDPSIAVLDAEDIDNIGTELADGKREIRVLGLRPGRAVITMMVVACIVIPDITERFPVVGGYYDLDVIVGDEGGGTGPGPTQVLATGLTISPTSDTIAVGDTAKFEAELRPTNVSNKTLQWTSSDPSVARVVDQFGTVLGVSPGTATITATTTDGTNLQATATVTVLMQPVQRILLSRTSATIQHGDQLGLTTAVFPTTAENRELSVSISDPVVISFEDGIVTGLSPGTATITFAATDGSGVTAQCTVTVVPRIVRSIALPSLARVEAGKQIPLTAAVQPPDATYQELSVDISDPSVISYENGMVTGLRPGTAVITFTATDGTGVTAQCVVTVFILPVKEIRLSRTSATIQPGDQFGLTATALPADATWRELGITVRDPSVISFEDGIIKGLRPGTATIIFEAMDGSGVKAQCTVTVKPRLVKSITLSDKTATIFVGGQLPLTAAVLPPDATNPELSITINKSDVISFENGVVTGLSPGTAIITFEATDGSKVKAQCTVVVRQPVEEIMLPSDSFTVTVGDQLKLTPTVLPANATNKTLRATVSDPKIISFKNGVVKGLAVGTATITFEATDGSGVTAQCEVEVEPMRFMASLFNALIEPAPGANSESTPSGCGWSRHKELKNADNVMQTQGMAVGKTYCYSFEINKPNEDKHKLYRIHRTDSTIDIHEMDNKNEAVLHHANDVALAAFDNKYFMYVVTYTTNEIVKLEYDSSGNYWERARYHYAPLRDEKNVLIPTYGNANGISLIRNTTTGVEFMLQARGTFFTVEILFDRDNEGGEITPTRVFTIPIHTSYGRQTFHYQPSTNKIFVIWASDNKNVVRVYKNVTSINLALDNSWSINSTNTKFEVEGGGVYDGKYYFSTWEGWSRNGGVYTHSYIN